MKIFIDIDNTIFHTIGNRYEQCTPIFKNIEKANKLFDEGHQITYWTARGCKSGKTAEYFNLTIQQLKRFNVKFHELRMGKPHFDLFIDDKNINAINDWNDENISKILETQKLNDSKRVDSNDVKQYTLDNVSNNIIDEVFNNINNNVIKNK